MLACLSLFSPLGLLPSFYSSSTALPLLLLPLHLSDIVSHPPSISPQYPLAMNVNKKFDRFKQWGRERMGSEVKTDSSEDFKMLEVEMALRQEG